MIDWEKVKKAIAEKKGIAEDVTDEEKIKIALKGQSILEQSILEKMSSYIRTLFTQENKK